jgi:hypothetical protein
MNIKIVNDPEQVYKPNETMPASQLLDEYIEAINVDENGREQTKWLKSVPIKSAINHIAVMWGLDIEFID